MVINNHIKSFAMMKEISIKMYVWSFVFLFFVAVQASAQSRVIEVKLWNNSLPNSNGHDDGTYDIADKNYKPLMRVFLPSDKKVQRRAILCFPGGGYSQTSGVDRYTKTWVPYYMNQDIVFILLRYREPYGNPEVTLSDAYEGMRQIKLHAKEWGINPDDIGVQGLSAGGHLASTFVTHVPDSMRPAFQILIYPVITFDDKYSFVHVGSRDNFIGKKPNVSSFADSISYRRAEAKYDSLVNLYSNEKQVKSNNPRAFIAVSDNDKLLMNSILYYTALHNMNISAAIHVYPSGGHGWHIDDGRFPYSALVKEELTAWLRP